MFSKVARARRAPLALPFAGAAYLLLEGPALAYCEATTCGAASGTQCPRDAMGCVTSGEHLSWSTGCVSFAVDEHGSPKRNITYDVFDRIVRTSLQQWLAVDCGGGRHPSIALWDAADFAGPLLCDEPEYNQTGPNANGWILRDGDWPYHDPGSEFGHTTITFDPSSGRILDADVEINSFGLALTTSDDDIVDDLQSITTHEAGHFLGLADSSDPDATMSATYSPASRKARSLDADDKAAICALYPPNRDVPACTDPSPSHGYSSDCAGAAHPSGCSVTRASRDTGSSAAAVGFLGAAALLRKRRRAAFHARARGR
ncbi:MAG TPA: matrixin family metalloprotease [Polyangiaceae bacterium]|nr:matrixin family metalloprotease [Polyangiaceae bacterium]